MLLDRHEEGDITPLWGGTREVQLITVCKGKRKMKNNIVENNYFSQQMPKKLYLKTQKISTL